MNTLRIDRKKIKDLFRKLWPYLPWIVPAAIGILFIAIIIKVQGLSEAKNSDNTAQQIQVNVVTQLMSPAAMKDEITLPAVVQAWEDLMIKTEVNGKVVAVRVAEGDAVKKNQILVEIDRRDYRNRVRSLGARQELAQANHDRLQSLFDKAAIAQARLDEARASLKELNAELDNARLELERCTIRAPMAGIINDLPAREGMLLAHGDPVAQLLVIDRLKVEVAIPETDVKEVQQIEQCRILFSSLDNREVTGEKIFLACQPLQSAMVYTLRLAIDNPDAAILPGMFARAVVVKKTVDQAYGVPLYAVLSQDNEQFVYVAENNIARKRQVTTGFLEGWKVRIRSGLKAGDQVVLVGHRNLADGQPVKIVRTVTDPADIGK